MLVVWFLPDGFALDGWHSRIVAFWDQICAPTVCLLLHRPLCGPAGPRDRRRGARGLGVIAPAFRRLLPNGLSGRFVGVLPPPGSDVALVHPRRAVSSASQRRGRAGTDRRSVCLAWSRGQVGCLGTRGRQGVTVLIVLLLNGDGQLLDVLACDGHQLNVGGIQLGGVGLCSPRGRGTAGRTKSLGLVKPRSGCVCGLCSKLLHPDPRLHLEVRLASSSGQLLHNQPKIYTAATMRKMALLRSAMAP